MCCLCTSFNWKEKDQIKFWYGKYMKKASTAMRLLTPKKLRCAIFFNNDGESDSILHFFKFEVLLPNYNIKIILRLCKYCQNGTITVREAYNCLMTMFAGQHRRPVLNMTMNGKTNFAIYHIITIPCTLRVFIISKILRNSCMQIIQCCYETKSPVS